MKMKKKCLTILLASVLALSLTACGGGDDKKEEKSISRRPHFWDCRDIGCSCDVYHGAVHEKRRNHPLLILF